MLGDIQPPKRLQPENASVAIDLMNRDDRFFLRRVVGVGVVMSRSIKAEGFKSTKKRSGAAEEFWFPGLA